MQIRKEIVNVKYKHRWLFINFEILFEDLPGDSIFAIPKRRELSSANSE